MLRRNPPETSVTNNQLSRRCTPEKFNLYEVCPSCTSVKSCLFVFASQIAVHLLHLGRELPTTAVLTAPIVVIFSRRNTKVANQPNRPGSDPCLLALSTIAASCQCQMLGLRCVD